MNTLNERKCCETCKKPLISFMGQYLHVEAPCSGITDSIRIEATIQDEFIYNKWLELYGKPVLSDYERASLLEGIKTHLEQENAEKQALINSYEAILRNPLVKLVVSFVDWVKRRFF